MLLAARFREPPIDATQLPDDTASTHFRRVTLSGSYDYDHEVVLSARSLNGSPGVNLVTPLRPNAGGRAMQVLTLVAVVLAGMVVVGLSQAGATAVGAAHADATAERRRSPRRRCWPSGTA